MFKLNHTLNIVQIVQPKSALVVVDIQNDFISGSLASPGAEEVISVILIILTILIIKVIGPINTLVDSVPFTQLWYSLDWHPRDHISFIENISLNPLHSENKQMDVSKYKVTDEVIFSFPVKTKQILWPQHCVQVR